MTTRTMLTETEKKTLRTMKRQGAHPCIIAQLRHEMLTGETGEVLAAWRARGWL